MAKRSQRSRRALRLEGATLSKSSTQGFDTLKAVLQELPRATQRTTLKKAAKQALQPTFEQAKSSAPVLTGQLRDSIFMDIRLDDPEYRARARASFKAKGHARGVKKTKGGGNVVASIRVGGRQAFHAPFVEFGTVKMAADPFLRPAFDANADKMVESLRASLEVEVRKAAVRRAKKLAKG